MPAENPRVIDVGDNPNDKNEVAVTSSLKIPIQSSTKKDLFIEIFPEELKEIPSSTLLQVLQDEKASQDTWANVGLSYMQQNLAGESSAILQAACSTASGGNGSTNVRLLASAGIAHLAVGNSEEDRRKAEQRFTSASKEDTFFPMNWMGQGFLNFRAKRLDQARFFFDTTLKQCGPVLPALLGMAAVLFCEGKYKQAQDLYGQAMKLYPTSLNSTTSASIRVGFGLASYRLGQVDRAKASFRRALDLDPECVSAMVATAILTMSNIEQGGRERERAMKLMSMAHLLDHSNAMVQNHLANHYFWKWTPLPGHVSVKKGSSSVKTSQPIPLDAGEHIRIGMKLETIVQDEDAGDSSENAFLMKDVWTEDSDDNLKLWKKDYDRVSALAKGAYSSTTVEAMQAESLFLLARVHHVREEMENANKLYEKACKLAPDLAPARFGLAQTLLAQEDYKNAMMHLKLVVKTSATAADALALLGLLEVKSGGQSHTKEGLLHLRKAIDLEPLNPDLIVMEALALQQEKASYPKALERYKKAAELLKATKKEVPYELFCNIGVLCHETKMYDHALQYYAQALEVLDKDSEKKDTGTTTEKNDPDNCINQAANNMFWEFKEVGKVMVPSEGSRILQLSGSAPSLKKGHHVRIGDTFISEITDIKEESIELKEAFIPPPQAKPQDNESKSDETEQKEKEKDETEGDNEKKSNDKSSDKKLSYILFIKRENERLEIHQSITIAFNIARVHENTGNTLAAVELHKAIVKRVPAYVNCYLRLACIARDSGCLKECSSWLKLACTIAPGNPEVLTLVGNLHLSLCDWGPAQNVFDQLLLKRVSKVEAYSKLSMGNIFFANLDNPKTYAKNLKKAVDLYKSILAKDKSNAYAANGIGTYLAEKGQLFKAKEVFNRVREVSGDTIADALLNLGHIYLAQKKHAEALQMYQSYMKRTQDGTAPITTKNRADDEAEVLLYIAFAYFDWARQMEHFNNTLSAPADKLYRQCMEHLEMALEKSKRREVLLQYNLCMTKLQAANCVLQKSRRNLRRTAKEVENALNDLESCLPKVENMLQWKSEGKKVLIATSILKDFITHCKENIDTARLHLEEERKREETLNQNREQKRHEAEQQKLEEEIREAEKSMIAKRGQEERDRRAAAKMRILEQLQHGWSVESRLAEKKNEGYKKKNQGKGRRTDTEIEVEEPEENNTLDVLFADSDSSDEDDEKEPSKSNAAGSEAKDEGTKPGEVTSQRDLFGDSSDDESDEELIPTDKKRPADNTDDEGSDQPAKRQRTTDDGSEEE